MQRTVVTAAIVLAVLAPAAPVHADDGGAAAKTPPLLCSLAELLGLELSDCEKKATP